MLFGSGLSGLGDYSACGLNDKKFNLEHKFSAVV